MCSGDRLNQYSVNAFGPLREGHMICDISSPVGKVG